MHKIDLNCDLGESFGNYKLGLDDEVIKYISSANIACGFHASDPLVMQKTVALARDNGVAVGAHPGFPDLVGFGRRNMNVSPAEAKAFVQYQIGALSAFCKAAGCRLAHVKSAAKKIGLRAASEVFADRAYEDDGSLVARGKPGAVITDEDEAVSRVIGMVKNGTVESINGKTIELKPDSICLHGDGVKAVEFARRIKAELNANGIETAPLAQII